MDEKRHQEMKNDYEIRGDIAIILLRLKSGIIMETIIDLCDFEKVNQYPQRWFAQKTRNGFYARCDRNGPLMQRVITNAPENMIVDHINHDTLDNRRCNLKVCTAEENQLNRIGAQKNSRTGIRGVIWDKQAHKYRAELQFHNKHFCVGYYDDAYQAGRMVLAGIKMAERLEEMNHG